MNDIDWSSLCIKLIPENHLAVALDARRGKANIARVLFEKVSGFCRTDELSIWYLSFGNYLTLSVRFLKMAGAMI